MSTELLYEIIFHALSLVITLVVTVITYKIKIEQGKVKAELLDYQRDTKEELVKNQNDLRLDLTVKHTENKATFVAHAAEDARQFGVIAADLREIKQTLHDIS